MRSGASNRVHRTARPTGSCRSGSPPACPELTENRHTCCAPIVDVVVAGRQVWGIGILLEHPPDDRHNIEWGLGPTQRRKPFVNRLADHIRQGHTMRAKLLRLAKSVG